MGANSLPVCSHKTCKDSSALESGLMSAQVESSVGFILIVCSHSTGREHECKPQSPKTKRKCGTRDPRGGPGLSQMVLDTRFDSVVAQGPFHSHSHHGFCSIMKLHPSRTATSAVARIQIDTFSRTSTAQRVVQVIHVPFCHLRPQCCSTEPSLQLHSSTSQISTL